MTSHAQWNVEDVTNVSGAEFAARNYIEQCDIRRYMRVIDTGSSSAAACELGPGFGRLTVVLKEFFSIVVAFEREGALAEKGSYLFPDISFLPVESLAAVPATDSTFDVALIFTVLQHMTDDEVTGTLEETGRILKPGGNLLLCEHTDPTYVSGSIERGSIFTVGRSVYDYLNRLKEFTLMDQTPRRVQPGGSRADCGHYLLLRKS